MLCVCGHDEEAHSTWTGSCEADRMGEADELCQCADYEAAEPPTASAEMQQALDAGQTARLC